MLARAYFAHTSPEGEGPGERLSRISPRAILLGTRENLLRSEASGEDPPEPRAAKIVGAWMDSAGHRENLLNGETMHVGFGVASGTRRERIVEYTVQLLATVLGHWDKIPDASIRPPVRWLAQFLVPAEFFLDDTAHPSRPYPDPKDSSRYWIGGIPLVVGDEGEGSAVAFPKVEPGKYQILVRLRGAESYQPIRAVRVEAAPAPARRRGPPLPRTGASSRGDLRDQGRPTPGRS